MAVDLGELVDVLKGAVNVPGEDLFPDATDDDWLVRLQNGFWDARLAGLFANYREGDGEVVPLTGTVDLPRQDQQAIVLWSAYKVVWTKLLSLPTAVRRKAGPVSIEEEHSSQVLQALLADIRSQLDKVVKDMTTASRMTKTYFLDAVAERDRALVPVDPYWLR